MFLCQLVGSDRKNLLSWQGSEREETFLLSELTLKFLSFAPLEKHLPLVSTVMKSNYQSLRTVNTLPGLKQLFFYSASVVLWQLNLFLFLSEPRKQVRAITIIPALAAEGTLAGLDLTQHQ